MIPKYLDKYKTPHKVCTFAASRSTLHKILYQSLPLVQAFYLRKHVRIYFT